MLISILDVCGGPDYASDFSGNFQVYQSNLLFSYVKSKQDCWAYRVSEIFLWKYGKISSGRCCWVRELLESMKVWNTEENSIFFHKLVQHTLELWFSSTLPCLTSTFHATGLFLYPPKTSENQRFFDVFRRT